MSEEGGWLSEFVSLMRKLHILLLNTICFLELFF